jgi:plastocyanin
MRKGFRSEQWVSGVVEAIDGLRTGRLDRRQALRLLGGAGLATAGLLGLARRGVLAQEGGTPPPMATPQIGEQADGSTVWRIKVGDMRMDQTPLVELMAFFPGEITVAEGDAIWFDFGMGAFHTVSFASGGELPELIVPDPEAATPAAGEPPKLILNPAVVFPAGTETYDGAGYLHSGIDVFRDPTQPYVVTFTAAGTYDYVCIVHATVMKGRVIVQPAGTAAPTSQADYDRAAAEEIATLYAQADAEVATYQNATSTPNADGTTTWEATVGAGGETPVRVQAFLPAELEVKVGDTVRWTHRAAGEPHTVSFLGAGEVPPEDPVEQFADGSPKFVQNPLVLFPSGGNVWSGTGWVHSGFLNYPQVSPETEFSLTFDTPGEYTYFCFLHGDAEGNRMAAKLTVTPA